MKTNSDGMNFHERQEEVWIVQQEGAGQFGFVGVAVAEAGASQLPGIDRTRQFTSTKAILFRPTLAPIYGGPTLLEALWAEMDRLMESLMTGVENDEDVCGKPSHSGGALADESGRCEHFDNGDKYRAQELAWVLAIVTNAYAPSVELIRKEAVARWNAAQKAGK